MTSNLSFNSLLDWMDAHFGHDLTNVIISSTVISRGVSVVLSSPQFRNIGHLKQPITILLQAGFPHEFRNQKWVHILQNAATTHVVTHFSGLNNSHLPETKGAINVAVSLILDELRNGR